MIDDTLSNEDEFAEFTDNDSGDNDEQVQVDLTGLLIRRATPEDKNEIVGLLAVQFAEFTVDAALHPVPGLESAVEYYDREVVPHLEDGAIFVAEHQGELLGWAHWLPAKTPTQTLYRTVIGGTFVLPEYRKLGIGTQLREAAAAHCLGQGYEVMFATLEVGNRAQLNSIPGVNPMVVTINVQVRLNEIVVNS